MVRWWAEIHAPTVLEIDCWPLRWPEARRSRKLALVCVGGGVGTHSVDIVGFDVSCIRARGTGK